MSGTMILKKLDRPSAGFDPLLTLKNFFEKVLLSQIHISFSWLERQHLYQAF